MKRVELLLMGLSLLLASCTSSTPTATPSPIPPTAISATRTARIVMLPTWTPSPTTPRNPTSTPRDTPTPLITPGGSSGIPPGETPAAISNQTLLDRPTYALPGKPAYLVSMQYDPGMWSLNSFYPTSIMGYSLSSRAVYGCKLEPSVGIGTEGYEIEKYNRPLGTTTYEIVRVSQAGELLYANYCTGSGQNYTCYQVTPGNDHLSCIQAAEEVLSSYKLITNPFYGEVITSPNRWICQNQAGTVGLCSISYSVMLNALSFRNGEAWAAGDDGKLLHFNGQTWSKISSPTTNKLYDLQLTSPGSGWAVGEGAQVLKWDATGWSVVLPYHASGEGPGGSTQVLYAVNAWAANNVWMVGAMKGIDGKNSPYGLHWNGTQLVEVSDFPDCNCGLNAVLAVGEDDVYAAGGSDLGAIIFHWNGTEWSSSQLPGADHLYALSQGMDGSIFAAGIEVARDQSDTRGAVFQWDGTQWQRIALPPLTGGIYALTSLATGQIVVGGDFSALRNGSAWQPITTDIAAFGWIVDIEQDPQGNVWALTRSGNLFKLKIGK